MKVGKDEEKKKINFAELLLHLTACVALGTYVVCTNNIVSNALFLFTPVFVNINQSTVFRNIISMIYTNSVIR